ncbi:hypothetical protein ACFQPG_10825 [Sphingomonas sp. GCM10030256]|uniref:hypothetical protein n=1 Tax=Sphingomonas sp. GCM10030256 TaxID=3273427 RepID=UPI0036213649
MQNPYLEMLRLALGDLVQYVPHFVFLLVLVGLAKLIDAKTKAQRRSKWKGAGLFEPALRWMAAEA